MELIGYIKEFHRTFEYYTDLDSADSKFNKWNNGLVQGSSLSPVLFVLVMNYILNHINVIFFFRCVNILDIGIWNKCC